MISIEEARALMTRHAVRLPTEDVDLGEAFGRALAVDLVARRALPAFDNSAMDGYAVRSVDLALPSLRVTMQIPAGVMPDQTLGQGEAARIFTGAPMPAGADTVVMQENVEADGDRITLTKPPDEGANVRRAGEDMSVGEVLITAGTTLGAGHLAVAAAQGLGRLSVVRRPRVAIVPNGDELVPVGVDPNPGQIPNTNAPMLAAQVRNAGGEPWVFPPVADDRDAIAAAMREAGRHADLVLTTGGMSVGDFDHARDVLAVDASLDFYKVRVKPGKPLGLGRIGSTPVLGLPGNPVSAFVGFEIFGRPLLRTLGGFSNPDRPRFQATLAREVRPNRTRPEFIRCDLIDGQLHPWPKQGSAMMSSLLHADALALIPAGTQTVAAGSTVQAVRLG